MADLPPAHQVEALLFGSGRSMSEETLANLTKLDVRTVKRALTQLQKTYEEKDGALRIFNDPTGWRMLVRDAYTPLVKHIVADTELSRACMETLAVIAYKYPKALQSEVVDIRGGGAYEHLAELERLGFIVRMPEGRSYRVKLTERFFNYFDVADGKDIRDVFKNVRIPKKEIGQKTLGELPVVDVPKEHKHKTLEGMQIVDVGAAPEPVPGTMDDTAVDADDAIAEPEKPTHDPAYLSDLDERIARLQERNNTNDKDELFQRKPLPGQEAAQETQEQAMESSEERKDA